jgi:hypothetical protein
MYLKDDKRKLLNLGIFSTIWILSGIFFCFQYWMESKSADEELNRLINILAGQIRIAGSNVDSSYLHEECFKTTMSFFNRRQIELTDFRNWIDNNIHPTLAKLEQNEIVNRLLPAKKLVFFETESKYVLHKHPIRIIVWFLCALAYSLLTLAVYSFSPLKAIETEAPLNVLDAGFIGTALQISGGLESPINFLWLIFYSFHGFVVGMDIHQTQDHRWAKHYPYFLAFAVTLFWATFQDSLSNEYWIRYFLGIIFVFAVVFLVFMYEEKQSILGEKNET